MATYFGGKNHLYQAIINLIPRHERFVEAFAGSAAVSRHLARGAAEAILVERDPEQLRWLRRQRELAGHRIVGGDAFEVLARGVREWGPETVVFADPPYPIADRRDARPRYRCELTDGDHRVLIGKLHKMKARVLVCGHPWGMYPDAFASWYRHELRTTLRGGGRPGIECVWTNYVDPFPLHDYRYFGTDKRVRQDLRRRIARQVMNFAAMDRNTRAAILGELVVQFPSELPPRG